MQIGECMAARGRRAAGVTRDGDGLKAGKEICCLASQSDPFFAVSCQTLLEKLSFLLRPRTRKKALKQTLDIPFPHTPCLLWSSTFYIHSVKTRHARHATVVLSTHTLHLCYTLCTFAGTFATPFFVLFCFRFEECSFLPRHAPKENEKSAGMDRRSLPGQ